MSGLRQNTDWSHQQSGPATPSDKAVGSLHADDGPSHMFQTTQTPHGSCCFASTPSRDSSLSSMTHDTCSDTASFRELSQSKRRSLSISAAAQQYSNRLPFGDGLNHSRRGLARLAVPTSSSDDLTDSVRAGADSEHAVKTCDAAAPTGHPPGLDDGRGPLSLLLEQYMAATPSQPVVEDVGRPPNTHSKHDQPALLPNVLQTRTRGFAAALKHAVEGLSAMNSRRVGFSRAPVNEQREGGANGAAIPSPPQNSTMRGANGKPRIRIARRHAGTQNAQRPSRTPSLAFEPSAVHAAPSERSSSPDALALFASMFSARSTVGECDAANEEEEENRRDGGAAETTSVASSNEDMPSTSVSWSTIQRQITIAAVAEEEARVFRRGPEAVREGGGKPAVAPAHGKVLVRKPVLLGDSFIYGDDDEDSMGDVGDAIDG